MRITNNMMVNTYMNNLNKNLNMMNTIQNQLSTGHKVSKPSDDPFAVTRTMQLNSSISANERYKKNIEEARGWIDTQEIAVGQMNTVSARIRELTVQASNGTNSQTDREAIASELDQLKDQLVEIANTSYDGRYIFSGQKTTSKPFEINNKGEVIYSGSEGNLPKEVAAGVDLNVGIDGREFFKGKYTDATPTDNKDSNGIFGTLDKILNAVRTGDSEGISNLIGDLDSTIENMSTIRSELGAKQKRLEDMHSKNGAETFNMTQLLSQTYDVDMAGKYMEAKTLEAVYQASLNVGARVIQPSILDFLR